MLPLFHVEIRHSVKLKLFPWNHFTLFTLIYGKIFGSYKITCQPDDAELQAVDIDFIPPLKWVSMMEKLEKATGEKPPALETLETEGVIFLPQLSFC